MKRYGNQNGSMVEHPNGAYADIADAQALTHECNNLKAHLHARNTALNAAKQRVAALEREREQLQRQLNFAVLLINRRRRDASAPPRRKYRKYRAEVEPC